MSFLLWMEASCSSLLVHRWSHPPAARVSFSAVREHAAGATSKKMILGGVPGVISGLAQKRSVSAFLPNLQHFVVPSR